jgi:hypothetical protein
MLHNHYSMMPFPDVTALLISGLLPAIGQNCSCTGVRAQLQFKLDVIR